MHNQRSFRAIVRGCPMIFSGVRESVSPAIAAVAMILIIFSALTLSLVGWLHSRRARLLKR
jgi:putative spermidine/putrescine transport system permease protein